MKRIESDNLQEKSSWSLLSAAASAIAASICCLGPLLLLALGITGAWIGNLTSLASYRPIFVIVALGFLGFTFHSVYRKPKTKSCPVERPCANPGGKRKHKIILWVVTALILGLLVFPYLVPYVFAETPTSEKVQTQQVVLEVRNMTCVSCVVAVKKSLTRLNGIKEARVTLEPPEAFVIFDPAKVKVEDLIKATTNAGYPSSIKQKKGN